jgi:hypothetical protein
MTDHAHIRLKDGRDLEFPLMLGWQAQVEQSELSLRDWVIKQGQFWFSTSEDFTKKDVLKVRVAG